MKFCFLGRRHRKRKGGVVYVTYRPKGFIIMSETKNIDVPLASTGLVAVAKFELDLEFGDTGSTDAQEQITYATGGLFTHVLNADETVTFTAAAGTTAGQTDTITVTDDSQTLTYTLTASPDNVTGISLEGVTYSHAPAAAPDTGAAA